MTETTLTRRALLASTSLLAGGIGLAPRSAVAQPAPENDLSMYVPEESDYPYEIQRTEAEWCAHLDDDDFAYQILRRGKTETPKTTDMWLEAHDGEYHCRGCDLPIYEGKWFQPLTKGWVFFHHSFPNTILSGIDGPVPAYGQASMMDLNVDNVIIEVHCRRCGSHLGHFLTVEGMPLHCINGTALKLA